MPVTVDSSSSESDSEESESKSESDSSDSSDSEDLENWMILGRGTREKEDLSISLNLEGGSDGGNTGVSLFMCRLMYRYVVSCHVVLHLNMFVTRRKEAFCHSVRSTSFRTRSLRAAH